MTVKFLGSVIITVVFAAHNLNSLMVNIYVIRILVFINLYASWKWGRLKHSKFIFNQVCTSCKYTYTEFCFKSNRYSHVLCSHGYSSILLMFSCFFFQGFVNSGYGVNGIAHVSFHKNKCNFYF